MYVHETLTHQKLHPLIKWRVRLCNLICNLQVCAGANFRNLKIAASFCTSTYFVERGRERERDREAMAPESETMYNHGAHEDRSRSPVRNHHHMLVLFLQRNGGIVCKIHVTASSSFRDPLLWAGRVKFRNFGIRQQTVGVDCPKAAFSSHYWSLLVWPHTSYHYYASTLLASGLVCIYVCRDNIHACAQWHYGLMWLRVPLSISCHY